MSSLGVATVVIADATAQIYDAQRTIDTGQIHNIKSSALQQLGVDSSTADKISTTISVVTDLTAAIVMEPYDWATTIGNWSQGDVNALDFAGLLPFIPTKIDDTVSGIKKITGKTDDIADLARKADIAAIPSSTKPIQTHHILTNKSKTYTPLMEEITNKYNLNLNRDWNKIDLPHLGRHPNVYHDYVLSEIIKYDEIAQGNQEVFLLLFSRLRSKLEVDPDILYRK